MLIDYSTLCKNNIFIRGLLHILISGEIHMSQANIEDVKKRVDELVKKAEELKKTASELRELAKTSDLTNAVEKLNELKDTLRSFLLRDYTEFSITLRDACVSTQCEDVEVIVERKSFRYSMEVKRSASVIDVYHMFFDNNDVLEHLIDNLVGAMVNVASEAKKSTDLLEKIHMLEKNIEWISRELDDIEEKLEDP
jgi:cell division septum initiation protein DivIVA